MSGSRSSSRRLVPEERTVSDLGGQVTAPRLALAPVGEGGQEVAVRPGGARGQVYHRNLATLGDNTLIGGGGDTSADRREEAGIDKKTQENRAC